jgi:predicted PilT family ATPase
MRLHRRLVGIIATAAIALAVAVPAAQAVEVDLHALLHGTAAFPNARGSSEYERGNGQRDVEVTVTGIRTLAGRQVTFFVAGTKIGTARVSSLGRVHIERDTEHGQSVPKASAGNGVSARTAGGTVIARGIYHRDVDDD